MKALNSLFIAGTVFTAALLLVSGSAFSDTAATTTTTTTYQADFEDVTYGHFVRSSDKPSVAFQKYQNYRNRGYQIMPAPDATLDSMEVAETRVTESDYGLATKPSVIPVEEGVRQPIVAGRPDAEIDTSKPSTEGSESNYYSDTYGGAGSEEEFQRVRDGGSVIVE